MAHRSDLSKVSILLQQLERCAREQWTGRLEIRSPVLGWVLECQGGGISGEGGGRHPIRRWRRQLSRYCPQLAHVPDLQTAALHQWSGCDWHHLIQWEELSRFRAEQVLIGGLQEVLFDCLQEENRCRRESDQELDLRWIPSPPHSMGTDLPQSLQANVQGEQAWDHWQTWVRSGLQGISPNLAPVIHHHSLRRHRSAPVFRQLAQMIDGYRTLRDLSLKLGQETVTLTQSLMPLIRQGSLQLSPVVDLGGDSAVITEIKIHPSPTLGLPEASSSVPPSHAPLIAYVDERQINGQIVGQIVQQMGCRYLNIHDPLQMIPSLDHYRPQLILIDLLMPLTSGYEVCGQIRSLPSLQSIPIALVASNPHLVDRVRAQAVGASDVIVRPVNQAKVSRLLHKHQVIPFIR